MEEPKSTFPKQRRNKTVISRIGKAGGGGGIGVGIIFLGGAVASAAAAFLIRRRLQKSTSNIKNCSRDPSTPSAEIPYKLLEDKNTNQAKGLKFIAPDSDSPACTDTHQNLSNGTAKTGIHENDNTDTSDQSFIQDQKYQIEADDGKGDPVADSEQLVHSNSPGGLVSSLQFDASPLKEEESPLPLVGNQALHQPKQVADRFSGEEIEIIREDDPVDAALVDQGTEKEKQKLENGNGEEMEINCCSDKDMGELNSQDAAETTKIEQRTGTLLQSGEEQENPFHCDQESESSGNPLPTKDQRPESEECCLAFETVEVIEKVEAAIVGQGKGDTMTQMTLVHGSPCTENLGVNGRNEKLEVSHGDQGKGNAQILMLAEEENKCDHHDSLLNIGANEETEGNDTLEAIDLDEHRGTVASMSEKGQRKCLVGSPTTESAEVKEKDEMMEEAEARDTEIISCEESQANGESAQFPHNIASASNQQKLHTEKPGFFSNVDHEDNSVFDELTSEDETCEDFSRLLKPEIGSDDGFTELQPSAEAAEARKENIVNEPASDDRVIESENSPMQLVEIQKNLNGDNEKQLEEVEGRSQVNYAVNVTIEEHNQTRPEEDSLHDEGDDDADEANMTDKVEDSSEGTGDSSVESNAEPIWPMDSLEEVCAEVKELKINGKKEEQDMEENQNVRTQQVPTCPQNIDNDGIIDKSIRNGNDCKSNSKLNFLERVMLELAEQTHQPTTYSQKLRILIPTILALSWSLCFWQLGPPFLKISLIVVLIKILSKIQGF
nr:uncharacterized protein LOC113735276 [Coffea arabica]